MPETFKVIKKSYNHYTAAFIFYGNSHTKSSPATGVEYHALQSLSLPTILTTMGSICSRPEEPKVRVLAHPIRDSVALRQRISLNRQTLARILEQIGHPAAHHARRQPGPSGRLGGPQKNRAQTSSSLPCESKTGRNRRTMRSSFGHTIMRKRRTAKPINVNKPLPPLPALPPPPPPPSSLSTTTPTPTPIPTSTPIPTAVSAGRAEPAPEHKHQKAHAQHEREHIARHRAEALRCLESRGRARGRAASHSPTRVPSIILRRIVGRRRAGAILLGGEGGMRVVC
ncbi:hypothetical protein MYCTH_2112012 [Thermothelomyces thermophilus ATCC 42464]|uniref:Uncharacterized protein n=1 Tax=Thermothelomyces thermophilus (strain ATCC 42464 / BCRC 31852 / DSM 1799) TaxID=573729 RepID=G2QJX6_THET4|nr:uncharacterized protein MYCTH_2112012 [Thermothelomyces thermophilus ATCC 42464]AEO59882.1 hypothetical protein MYCTH_2112012 [Thermothelomyces thermophilus ATCC 42464]